MWRSVPSGEPVECTGDGTDIGVKMAVQTSVAVGTAEVTVSWVVKLEQSGETGEVCEVTVTEVVTAAAAATERSAAAALPVAAATAAVSRDKVSCSEET